MIPYNPPIDDMSFLLNDLGMLPQVSSLPGYEEADAELVEALLNEAGKLSSEVLAPLNKLGDEQGATFENGVVRTADGFADAYRTYFKGGWNALTCNSEYGGQQMPSLIGTAVLEMFTSANMAWSLCPILTVGAIESLEVHGTEELKKIYLPKLVSGEWPGTMNLTEPHAGSDLAELRCRAEPKGNHYRIHGQKIFISYGEHDMTDNIIHMVLARLPDAPEGTRGISLFLVPKVLVEEDGSLGQRNDLRCVSLEHKLGIHASPTCVMSFGDNEGAVGYLVGKENEGLKAMFTMMNMARFNVGLQGVSIAERAYQQARDFAKERVQGRIDGSGPEKVSIINHPDVRRMLMSIKAQTEAMRALAYDTAVQFDISKRHPDEATRAGAQARLDLLTPIVKAWSTDLGVELSSTAVQIHGGMGFIEETGISQHYRDSRIAPIYEGTNGIQARDLVGRKVLRDQGETAKSYIVEMRAVAGTAADLEAPCAEIGGNLHRAIDALTEATDWLIENGGKTPALAFAGATAYLELFGNVAGGALMTRAACAAWVGLENGNGNQEFYRTKLATARFYAEHVLPKCEGLAAAITKGADSFLSLPENAF
jgi:alkylation response protein AidB-like acyl-CoA dehydrogenase